MPKSKDAIYSLPQQQINDFQFDQSVAEVFPDMIQRSIPGYNTIIDSIGQLAGLYAQDKSQIFDLGCSLGAASIAIRRYIKAQDCKIIAVDNSPAMIDRCKLHLQAFKSDTPVEVICDDLQNIKIHDASMVVMNFTLQFIPPDQRLQILSTIYQGLKPGGILVLSEKLSHDTSSGNELLIDLHHEFKRRNGYSELEISQKRTALENVMLIDSFETHQKRLKKAGFSDVVMWFKCFNFASLVATK
jgi:tRNA (cmo5U34)-methyltransferase